MRRRPRTLAAALVCLCAATPLFTACSDGKAPASPSGEGRRAGLPSHCPAPLNLLKQWPPARFTGDLDGDGHADAVRSDARDGGSVITRIVRGGPGGSGAVTELPADDAPAAGIGDFDGDGALDLLTLAIPSSAESADGPQPATVLYGPLGRDGGAPRTTSLDVGHGGWVSVTHTAVGDFDGDGRDDVVTKAEYDEEDARLEAGMPDGVLDATFYRGTAEGLKPAGPVPAITGPRGSFPAAVGDFDGDGMQDILASDQVPVGEAGGHRAVGVYGSSEGPGRGEDRAGGLGTLKVGLRDITVCDINGDDFDDIAVASRADGPFDRALGGRDGLSVIDR